MPLPDLASLEEVSDRKLPDFESLVPDLSDVRLSPYEQADIAAMEAGLGKARTGMEPGTEFTTALATGIAPESAAGEALRKGISEVANIPTYLSNVARGRMAGMPGYVEPKTPEDVAAFGEALQKPFIPIPKFEIKPEDTGLSTFAKEAANVAISLPEFFETPLGVMTLGAAGTGEFGAMAVRRAFLADMMKNLGQQYPEMLVRWPQMSQQDRIKAVVDLSGTALLTGALARAEIPKVRVGPAEPAEFEMAPPFVPPLLPPAPTTAPAPMTAPLPVTTERQIEGAGAELLAPRRTVLPGEAEAIRAFVPRGVRRAPVPGMPTTDELQDTGPITSAAYLDERGQVHYGPNHPEILERLGLPVPPRDQRNTYQFGYGTENVPFVPRAQAGPIAEKYDQKLDTFDEGDTQPHTDQIAAAPGSETPLAESEPAQRAPINYHKAIESNDPDALDFLKAYQDWVKRRLAAPEGEGGIRSPEQRALDDEAIDRFGTDTNFPEIGWEQKQKRGFRWNRETKRFEKPGAEPPPAAPAEPSPAPAPKAPEPAAPEPAKPRFKQDLVAMSDEEVSKWWNSLGTKSRQDAIAAGAMDVVSPALRRLKAKAAPEPAAKEPWQMTQEDYWNRQYQTLETRREKESSYGLPGPEYKVYKGKRIPSNKTASDVIGQEHYKAVQKAIAQGKPVPAEVLADYPDLKPAAPAAEAPKAIPPRSLPAYGISSKDVARQYGMPEDFYGTGDETGMVSSKYRTPEYDAAVEAEKRVAKLQGINATTIRRQARERTEAEFRKIVEAARAQGEAPKAPAAGGKAAGAKPTAQQIKWLKKIDDTRRAWKPKPGGTIYPTLEDIGITKQQFQQLKRKGWVEDRGFGPDITTSGKYESDPEYAKSLMSIGKKPPAPAAPIPRPVETRLSPGDKGITPEEKRFRSTAEGQKAMQSRASRIGTLLQMNEAIRKLDPNEAYDRSLIETLPESQIEAWMEDLRQTWNRLKAPAAPQTAAAKVETIPEPPSIPLEHPEPNTKEAEAIRVRSDEASKIEDAISERLRTAEAEENKAGYGTKRKANAEARVTKLREQLWTLRNQNARIHQVARDMYLEHLIREGHWSQKWAAIPELLKRRAERLAKESDALRDKGQRMDADDLHYKARQLGEQARKISDQGYELMKKEASRQLQEAGATKEEADFEAGQSANMQMSYPGMKTMQEIPLRMRSIQGERTRVRVEAEAKALMEEYGVLHDDTLNHRISTALPNEVRAREIIEETRQQYEARRKEQAAKQGAEEKKAREAQLASLEEARRLQAKGKLQWVRKGAEGKPSYWLPVEGKEVRLKAAPANEFFVYHAGVSRWSVTEKTTGYMVGEGRTQGEAITMAEDRIAKAGKTRFEELLAKGAADAPPKPSLATPPPPPSMAGPGTPSATQPSDVPGSQLAQLTQTIRQQSLSPKEPLRDRIAKSINIADRWAAGKDAVTRGIGHVRAASSALLDAYLHLPEWRDFQTAVGRWTGADQTTAFEVRNFRKTINAAVPDKLRQEAITNWIQADGDEALLRERAAASKGRIRRGYEVALELNDAEKTLARNVSSYLDARLQEGIDAGLLKQGVDNYITQIWRRPTTETNRMWADLFGLGKLNPTFRFARKRIFDSYFEGEQAGFVPRAKDVGSLISAYDLAFNRALSARGLIRELHEGTAADGNPIVMISGSGVPVPKEEPVAEAFLIKPKTRPQGAIAEDGRPYRKVDHWALEDWKWVAKSETGQNIFVKGEMLVHPDYYRRLRNALKGSELRQNPIARTLLQVGSLAKQTKLSLSPFHTVQEGLHSMAHRVDPTGMVKSLATLDLNHPEQRVLVDHGLMIADPNAQELFAEGLSGGGLIGKIPGLGRLQQWYTEKTFQDFIPRLKMTMALDALERNRRTYAKELASGKVTDDQIVAMTARQSNAAFGEQNYRMMGRSPTVQDFLRLSLLAPDFLEARFRFVAQALKPYGREQQVALGLMAATLYTTSRILNKALDDDYHWDKPFSIFFKGREYHLRTLLGDVQHLLTDPRSFWYNRLAPITRTMSEYVTGRDDRGIKRNSAEQFVDFLRWFQPIPLQRRPGETLPQQALAASGVPSKLASKQQEIYQMADSWMAKQGDPKIKAAYDRRRQETRAPSPYTELRQALRMNEMQTATRLYADLLRGRNPENIRQAFNWRRPVTGSMATERAFLASLSPSERKIYDQAVAERKLLYDRFMQVYSKNLARPTIPPRVLEALTVKPQP